MKTSTGDKNKVVSGYPTFQLEDNIENLGYYAPRGYFVGTQDPIFGRYVEI